ncbi:ATP synthase subunit d, mitochondrial-like [Centruroides sculpturatus]|uniref:ATP synthase subunit d, mitochondrial-like n=1 Tax=Centruroides sculpturatus TaxID=218467 RepID=UPI000C6D6F5C|nr:ATP synthase subunit d, mitochondrial-like [Centruroides sculpturatus]
MAARRIGRSAIDWAAFVERVPENQKSFFQAFKIRSDEYIRRVNSYPENPPAIDWEFYRKRIAMPGIVNEFEKAYNSLKVPYPTEKTIPEIDAQEKASEKKVEEFIKASNERIAKYQKELDSLKAIIPFEEMTMEDFYDAFPQYALNPKNPTFWPHSLEDLEKASSQKV